MTIVRVNAGGWGVGDKLTSAQANGLDLNTVMALDKRAGQTDTLASIVSCGGAGRIVDSYAAGADADTTYLLSGANSIINASNITAPRNYTLSNTGAIAGDRVTILNSSGLVLNVKNNSGTIIAQLGPDVQGGNDSSWADFIFNGGSQWLLWRSSKPALLAQTVFTSNGTWTCPRGVTLAMIIGWGSGGAGGGPSPPAATNDISAGGGGGGAGAQLVVVVVPVTAGVGYTVTIGGASSGGGRSVAGQDGTASTFGALVTCPGGGGGGSSSTAAVATYFSHYGGTSIAQSTSNTSAFYNGSTTSTVFPDAVQGSPGSGGRGFNYNKNTSLPTRSVDGQSSVQGFAGGAAGTHGSGTGPGGGGGGGGGGPNGAGGAGGAGGNGTVGAAGSGGANGSNGAVNSGAGGGGGGAGGSAAAGAGSDLAGGNGGSGQVAVIPLR